MPFSSHLLHSHDPSLVALAALFCVLGCWVTVRLLRCAKRSSDLSQVAWVLLGSLSGGSTVWCTHFVAMLSFQPGVSVSYDATLTAASLAVAVAGSGLSFMLFTRRFPRAVETAGVTFGSAVALMHYTGMAAFTAEATVEWNGAIVVLSVVFALVISLYAFRRAATVSALRDKIIAVTAFVVAIVSLHFTGMEAMTVVPLAVETIQADNGGIHEVLALSTAGVGLLMLAAGAVSYVLDRESNVRAAARLRYLTESAVDGMAVEHNGAVIEVNAALLAMTGRSRNDLIGAPFTALVELSDQIQPGTLIEADLIGDDEARIPVEIVSREEVSGESEDGLVVYAVRDLRTRKAQQRRINYLARTDSLTGLPNRAAFLDLLESSIAKHQEGEKLALLAIDLNRFKEINDLHGHGAGDYVLQALSRRMLEVQREDETIARLGGDEFVALAKVEDRGMAASLADRLAEQLISDVEFGESTLRCGASIGVAIYPDDADTLTGFMNNADLAMYRAKSSLSESVSFYDASMDEAIRARKRMGKELREALQQDQFEIHYQVQVSILTQEELGFEALLRWRHPERGYISPAEFIPIAEETGAILPIGEWVLRNACMEAAAWEVPHKIAINLSGVQLGDMNLPKLVADVLAETGLAPERLELEVTETSLIKDHDRAAHIIDGVKELGVSIAMDDFGTGYSSLSMLQAFPFDKIKLDKSLLDGVGENEQSQAILRAVLSLGGGLNIPVLAEGVETKEQLAFLQSQGCDAAQGYYFGRPTAPDLLPAVKAPRRSA